jgi:ATP dependent DNA ligase C terminal region
MGPQETARAVRGALAPLARSTSPLTKPIKKRDTTWVEPRFDAEITYADVTDDGMVRHPSFKRLVARASPRRADHIGKALITSGAFRDFHIRTDGSELGQYRFLRSSPPPLSKDEAAN